VRVGGWGKEREQGEAEGGTGEETEQGREVGEVTGWSSRLGRGRSVGAGRRGRGDECVCVCFFFVCVFSCSGLLSSLARVYPTATEETRRLRLATER
jgi:hypothetical protein